VCYATLVAELASWRINMLVAAGGQRGDFASTT
jgi:hypothetical protein